MLISKLNDNSCGRCYIEKIIKRAISVFLILFIAFGTVTATTARVSADESSGKC